MKARRANVRSCVPSGSRVAESSAFPMESLQEDVQMDNAEIGLDLEAEEKSVIESKFVLPADPTPKEDDAQDASRLNPLALEQLMTASLQRIQSLEEQVASLKSTVSSPLSSPTRPRMIVHDSFVQNETRARVEIKSSTPPRPMANPFMKSLLAEMKTVKLKPIPHD